MWISQISGNKRFNRARMVVMVAALALFAAFVLPKVGVGPLQTPAVAQNAAPGNPSTGPASGPAAPPSTIAPANASAAEAARTDQTPGVTELFQTSPVINTVLLAMSFVGLFLFLYLLMSLTVSSLLPPRFADDVTKLILSRQFTQAIHLCQNYAHVFASGIIQRCIENRHKEHGTVLAILQAEGRRRAEIIWNRVSYLAEISNIAPMLGLLGTVVGMIKVFFNLDTRTSALKSLQLQQGIAEAMGTTMFGLIVAIMCGALYTFIKGRTTTLLVQVEQACTTIADHTHLAGADERGEATPAPASQPGPRA